MIYHKTNGIINISILFLYYILKDNALLYMMNQIKYYNIGSTLLNCVVWILHGFRTS